MEVHHHSHLAPGETYTPRKKWTHYFWEFLMLFLAVFAGFLAENQREHFIEHKREKQYIRSFIEDLKADTAGYNYHIQNRTGSQIRADSLIILLLSPERKNYLDSIYVRAAQFGRGTIFAYNDRTIQQLKNAGGMRLIRTQAVSDSIMDYDRSVRNMQHFELKREEHADRFREIAPYVFDAAVFHSMVTTDDELKIVRPKTNPKLFSDNPETINRLCFVTNNFRIVNRQVIVHQTNLKNKAIRIMEFLRKEYKLE